MHIGDNTTLYKISPTIPSETSGNITNNIDIHITPSL